MSRTYEPENNIIVVVDRGGGRVSPIGTCKLNPPPQHDSMFEVVSRPTDEQIAERLLHLVDGEPAPPKEERQSGTSHVFKFKYVDLQFPEGALCLPCVVLGPHDRTEDEFLRGALPRFQLFERGSDMSEKTLRRARQIGETWQSSHITKKD
jgi:hypothetical protein